MTGYFEFANPTRLCAGKGAIGNLAYELKMLQVMRPMILSDAVLAKIGTLHMVLDALREVRIGRIFTDIPRDSSIETVNRIAQEYRIMAVMALWQSAAEVYWIRQREYGFSSAREMTICLI